MSAERTSHERVHFPLLATRFFIPQCSITCVLRSRLMERLGQGLQAPLILVSAPPGFGKSSLLAEWILKSARLALWLAFFGAIRSRLGAVLPLPGCRLAAYLSQCG